MAQKFLSGVKITAGDENTLYLNTGATGQQTAIYYQVDGSYKYEQRVGTNWELYNYTTSNWDFHLQGSTGYLALGHNSPGAGLHVKGTTNLASRFIFTKDLSTDKILFGGADHDNFDTFVGSSSNHSFTITQNGAAAVTIDTSKNATFAGAINLDSSHVNIDGNGAVIFDNTNNNNAWYIRNGGTNSATLQFGLGTPGSNIKHTFNGDDSVNFAGDVTIASNLEVTGSNIELGGNWEIKGTDGSYFQRIKTIDSSSTDPVDTFSFDVKLGTSEDWKSLLVLDQHDDARFSGTVTIPNYVYHTGDSNTYFGFEGDDSFRVVAGGGEKLHISTSRARFNGHLYVAADSTYDIGQNTTRWRNVYADTLYGDGSNLTGITATDNTKLPLAGGTMSGDIAMGNNDITGVKFIQANGNVDIRTGSGEYALHATQDGQTSLYHNGVKKFETTSAGIEVVGDIMPSADSTYDIGSNANKWAEGHFDHIYIGETGNYPRIDIYTEDSTANIADSFADTTTDKSYIYFQAGSGSSDPGYIMHETSDSENNEGVLHLVPSDDNATGDYVSIHGTNDADVLKLHTSGLIETVNLQLQIKSGYGEVHINDALKTTGHITTSADGTYNIGSNGSRFATGYFDAVGVTNTLTVGTINATDYGLAAGDIPDISTDKLTSGTLPVTRGGTGLTANTTYINSNAFANMQSSSADYDTLTTRGLYRFTGGSNGPAGTSHTTGLTLTENNGNYGWQMASNSSSNNAEGLYYRYRGTSWGPWQTLVTKTFGDGRYLKITDYNPTPNAPTNLTTTIVNETINVTFTASSTSNIDYYLVFSSVAGGDYGLISLIPPDDFSATMSVIDDSFDRPGTQAYRIYAVKNGVYSSALTGSKSYTISTTEPTNMSVIAMNNAYYVQWDPPSTNARFVANYNVYKHEHATASSLSFSSASLVYSGTRTSYMYAISGASNNNFHKFWVTITMAS
jgi:hypothetical protein